MWSWERGWRVRYRFGETKEGVRFVELEGDMICVTTLRRPKELADASPA